MIFPILIKLFNQHWVQDYFWKASWSKQLEVLILEDPTSSEKLCRQTICLLCLRVSACLPSNLWYSVPTTSVFPAMCLSWNSFDVAIPFKTIVMLLEELVYNEDQNCNPCGCGHRSSKSQNAALTKKVADGTGCATIEVFCLVINLV